MGRPRRDSNKSDSGSAAGNVYNAISAAASQQQVLDFLSTSSTALNDVSINNTIPITISSSSVTDAISMTAGSAIENGNVKSEAKSDVKTEEKIETVLNLPQSITTTPQNRRSLSISELVSLVSSRNNNSTTSSTSLNPTHSALNALNLPDALRTTLEKADSPILSALLPLIRQKLAAKTALNRQNSAVDPMDSTFSVDSQISRRSSTSGRSEDHRLSHKLAERKRRKEMKDVFDNLKDALPRGVPKSSKWEILNEASNTIDELLAQEQALLHQRNELLKHLNNK